MMKTFRTIVFVALLACIQRFCLAQQTNETPLWPDGAPGALGKEAKDIPTLTPFVSDTAKPNGGAIIICPGGGYAKLAPHEGRDYALFLNMHGITCFVLKYRLGTDGYKHPCEIQDASRAIRYVRANADAYKLDVHKIGMMGSSAGGHVTAMLLTHFDDGKPDATDPIERQNSRPDFGVLCYPVITMGPFAHSGSKKYLLGPNPSDDLIKETSPELHVTPQTPPCFIWQGDDDKTVPVENSLLFADALKLNKVPFELHIFEHTKHGIGLADKPPFEHPHPWAGLLVNWLVNRGLIDAPATATSTTKP